MSSVEKWEKGFRKQRCNNRAAWEQGQLPMIELVHENCRYESKCERSIEASFRPSNLLFLPQTRNGREKMSMHGSDCINNLALHANSYINANPASRCRLLFTIKCILCFPIYKTSTHHEYTRSKPFRNSTICKKSALALSKLPTASRKLTRTLIRDPNNYNLPLQALPPPLLLLRTLSPNTLLRLPHHLLEPLIPLLQDLRTRQ